MNTMTKPRLTQAYVTLLSTRNYVPGVIGLYRSLMKTGTKIPFIVICQEDIQDCGNELNQKYGMSVIYKFPLPYPAELKNSVELDYWKYTFFKLTVLDLNIDKVVMLDSDMLINQNIDHLFSMPHGSAVSSGKIISPDDNMQLNSGLIVLEPNKKQFLDAQRLIPEVVNERTKLALSTSDQDVFQKLFSNWLNEPHLHLNEEYNIFYNTIVPAALGKKIKLSDIKIVHFVGSVKPWMRPWHWFFARFIFSLKSFIQLRCVVFFLLRYKYLCRP